MRANGARVLRAQGRKMFDRRLLGLAPGAMRHIVATVAWLWVGLAANVVMVYGITVLMASIVSGGETPLAEIPLLLCPALIKVASSRLSSRASFRAARDVKRILRGKVYEKMLRLGPTYLRDVTTAEVVQVSVEGTEQLETYFGKYLPQLLYALLAPVTLFSITAPISVLAAVVLLVFVPLIPLVIMVIQRVAKRLLGSYWDEYAALGDGFLENLQGLTTLKIYQADEARHRQMNEEAERFRVITMKVLRMQLNSIIVMDVIALGGAAAGIGVALLELSTGSVALQGFLMIALLSADFFLPMRQLGSFFHVAMNGMAASRKIFRILDLDEPCEKTLDAVPGDTLSMSDACFSYGDGREVLHGVSMEVPASGVTAIVGGSGCGKSTVAQLFAGLSDAYSGDVRLGGKQVRDIRRESLARTITSVGIGSYLFRGTVRDNLLMASPHASDDALWEALDAVALGAFLRGQRGLDTMLEGEGANLSGGQRQRLAIARALLHESPIYIFDEATSNIDVESEEVVMGVVRELAHERSVIVISHRLANVVDAERIYVLNAGSIVGVGDHDELLAGCPSYARLWRTQRELESYRGEGVHAYGE